MPSVRAEPYEFVFQPEHVGLVVIDMQRDFVDPGGFGEALGNDVSLLRKAVPPTARVLDAARKAGILVIHTREGHRPDLADLPPTKKARGRLATGIGDPGPMGRILVHGEYGHDIIDELKPAVGEPVVDKPGKGAFYATDLDAILKAATSSSSSSAASPPRCASTRRSAKPTIGVTTASCSQTASPPISQNSRAWRWKWSRRKAASLAGSEIPSISCRRSRRLSAAAA